MELHIIREKIFEISGQKVMLDFDLAGNIVMVRVFIALRKMAK
jgi:hypothetical protein